MPMLSFRSEPKIVRPLRYLQLISPASPRLGQPAAGNLTPMVTMFHHRMRLPTSNERGSRTPTSPRNLRLMTPTRQRRPRCSLSNGNENRTVRCLEAVNSSMKDLSHVLIRLHRDLDDQNPSREPVQFRRGNRNHPPRGEQWTRHQNRSRIITTGLLAILRTAGARPLATTTDARMGIYVGIPLSSPALYRPGRQLMTTGATGEIAGTGFEDRRKRICVYMGRARVVGGDTIEGWIATVGRQRHIVRAISIITKKITIDSMGGLLETDKIISNRMGVRHLDELVG